MFKEIASCIALHNRVPGLQMKQTDRKSERYRSVVRIGARRASFKRQMEKGETLILCLVEETRGRKRSRAYMGSEHVRCTCSFFPTSCFSTRVFLSYAFLKNWKKNKHDLFIRIYLHVAGTHIVPTLYIVHIANAKQMQIILKDIRCRKWI